MWQTIIRAAALLGTMTSIYGVMLPQTQPALSKVAVPAGTRILVRMSGNKSASQ